MKIYLDLQKQAITKTTDENIYQGDIYSNAFEILFYNYTDSNWFPTMSQLAPNGRKAGEFTADALEVGESHEVTEDGVTYLKFTFTMGTSWVLMKGRSEFYIWFNRLGGAIVQKKCVGVVNIMIDHSTEDYFIADPTFNPNVKAYIDACIAELGDGSPKYFDTASNIANCTEDKGLAVATDTGHLYYWDETKNSTTKYTDSGLVYNDLSAYYTKSEVYNKTEDDALLASKVNKADVADNLTTNDSDKVLSAKQGKVLKDTIDTLDDSKADKVDVYSKDDTYNKTEVNSALALKADKSDTYTKMETDGKLALKADKFDTYTRTVINNFIADLETRKANKSNTYTKEEIDTTINGIGEMFGLIESAIGKLESVQNVVDVVATKSALNSYDTSKLEENDKIQVIADETHDGASTIYNWSGSAWQYVGAYGTNSYTKQEINNYKKMWDNLVYSCNFSIDDSAKTMTISGFWAFTKYSFIVINDIAVRTISYASLSAGNYCLVIRNNALEFINFANAIQDGDMVLWIGYLSATGNIRTDIYRCNNKVTNLALSCSKNIKIDTTNKNFVIPNSFLFWNSGYASITAQNISYADYLNATCVLVYRNGVFKVLLLQNIELFYNDVIVAVVWFRNDGFVLRKVYVVNETPDKAFTELPLSSKIFMRVGVIGDSYTSGWIKDNAHKNNPNYSWVKYMKQLTGNEWTNFGVSGSSTKSWVDGTLGQLPQVQAKGNKCQAYIIGLMINNQSTGMQTYVPLGTSSDIGTNANSYYAYYYKLINALLSVNSNAIIFCNTCPRNDGNFPSYNQAVIDVVNYCQSESKKVYVIELRNYIWSNETFTNDALNGHYTAIGYEYMAEIFNKAFSDTINANASSLKEVNLIPYDSATVRGKEVIVSAGTGYGSTTYGHSSIHIDNPRKPTCYYYFPEEKSGTLALTSDIPTVNNPTITFTQGGTTKGSISLNQSTNQTIALDAGGGGGGTTVVANPTLSGDEASLEGAEIDGVKYKVGGGGKLYHHHILIVKSSSRSLTLNVVSSSNIPYTFSTLLEYIKSITNNASTPDDGYNCIARYDNKYGYCCMASNGFYAMPYNDSTPTSWFKYLEGVSVYDTITEV